MKRDMESTDTNGRRGKQDVISSFVGSACRSRGSLRFALKWNCSDDHLVVDGSQGSANEGTNPEDPLQNRKKESRKLVRNGSLLSLQY